MTFGEGFTFFVILLCLALSFFFTAAETALSACSRLTMQRLEHQGDRRAVIAARLLSARGGLMGVLPFGRMIVNITATALASWMAFVWFEQAGVIYTIPVMVVALSGISWVLPRTLALRMPDRVALLVARPTEWVLRLLAPVLSVIEALPDQIVSRFERNADERQLAESPDEAARADQAQGADLGKPDSGIFEGVLALRELEISDVMLHRTNMLTLCIDDPPEEIVAAAYRAPHTRWPLWSGSPENIIGLLHVKDLLRALQESRHDASKLDIRAIMTPPWFVPDTTPLYEQLKAFRRRKTPLALVVDEYGEVMGLVTIEDILDEFVGDIGDERDIAMPGVRPQPDGSVAVDGSVPIRDLNRVLDWNLPDEEATTVAGLVIHEARSIPETGQSFTFHGFRFQVLRRNRNRITALRIAPLAAKAAR
jgi:Mg2+/Co2+ transporter CorB